MSLIFPIILIVASLAVIIFLIVRKFPLLSLLDVDSIQEVREGKKKEELIKKRMEKSVIEAKKLWRIKLEPVFKKLREIQLAFRKYVGKVERSLVREEKKKSKVVTIENKLDNVQELRTLLQGAVYCFEHGDWEGAEKKYILAINIDKKNFDAYYGLGQVYINQKQLNEAEETFRFLHHLYPNDSGLLVKLAELAEDKGKIEEAIEYYEQSVLLEDSKASTFVKIAELLKKIGQLEPALEAIRQAVELEPQNPKYLDFFLETSIMLGDKKLAEEVYQQLRMVNPENQKLVSFKERIEKIN